MDKLEYSNAHGTYLVAVNKEVTSFYDVINELVVPVLRSAGFSDKTIKDYIESD